MQLQPGGSQGGEVKFLIGLLLTAGGLWLFFDSVHFTTAQHGWISGAMRGRQDGAGLGQTTSMGIVLIPLFIGVAALFFDAKRAWAWIVTIIGIAVLIVEIVSRFRPQFQVKGTHAVIMLVLMAGGLGMMLRAYVEDRQASSSGDTRKK